MAGRRRGRRVAGLPAGDGRALPVRSRAALDAERVLGPIDVFHATAYAVPRARRTPVVLTVHDLTLLRRPELGTPALRRSVAPRRGARRARRAS